MQTILPVQSRFDKGIPNISGNIDFERQRELLIAMDQLIKEGFLETPVIQYFLDAARVNKYISVFGTGKSARLTSQEHDNVYSNAVFALRGSILRKHLGLSLRKFALTLCHSEVYQWFCGINRFETPRVPGKSTIGELENSIPPELIRQLEAQLFNALQSETSQLLTEPLDFTQCYFDCTCIDANIHYPIDWVLLRDATRTLIKAVKRIRKAGLLHRMPCEPGEFISRMNNLCIHMTHAKRKKNAKKNRKNILRKMKRLMAKVAKHANNHLRLVEQKWETTGMARSYVQQIIEQITNVTDQLDQAIKNAHERIIGERQVKKKDKILSLYEHEVNIVVRKKAGAEVEFGNTLYIAEQADGMIVDWKFFAQQAPADCKMLKDSHQRIISNIGNDVKLMAGDRGFDSRNNQGYMLENHIYNAVCPRNPAELIERLKEGDFCQAQKRRSQTEARISILSHCFCGSPMRQKGFENREIHMGLSIFSHNLWVAARIKIKQEQQEQAA